MSDPNSLSRARNAARAERRSAAAVNHDPRATRTYEALTVALIALVQEKPLHAITVSELVGAAGVHRTTFYGHFPDIFEFAADVCRTALDQLAVAADAGPDHIAQMLNHIREHRPLYRLVFGPLNIGFSRALFEQATAIISRRAGDPVAAAFLAGGLAAVLAEWALSDNTNAASYADTIRQSFTRVNS